LGNSTSELPVRSRKKQEIVHIPCIIKSVILFWFGEITIYVLR
jgi:hypothetical protein